MRWKSSESAPFVEHIYVDNDVNDGGPVFDRSSQHDLHLHHHYHDDAVFGSTSCAEL